MSNPSDAVAIGLLEAAPDAIIGVHRDGCIAVVNAQTVRLFGFDRSELIGKPIELLIPERFRRHHPAHRRDYLQDLRPRPMGAGAPLAARRKDGSEFPAEISLSALPAQNMVVAAVRDVSDRVRREAKFQGLLEAAPDAIVGVAADGRISLVNAQAERLFGYQRSELLGKSIEVLVPPAGRPGHPEKRQRYFADPQPRPMGSGRPLAACRKDGSEFPAEISLSAFETEDGVIVSAAIRDVSERIEAQAERQRLEAEGERLVAAAERERLEAQLQQSQRLESLGQLAGGVAHDFNNLLAVMLNYTGFVAEQIQEAADADPGGPWPQAGRDLQQVLRAGQRATELTHQLLAFGRREVVRPRVLDLNVVIREVEQLLLRTLGEHIRLQAELEPELWPVLADPGQIEQVLVNLAVNARDAMPGGGTLTLHTGNVEITAGDDTEARPAVAPGRYAELRVADTGTGIPPEVLERVFEPFYTTKPPGQGTGLGLATVYGIVTQAGGTADLRSTVGAGTVFTVLLPVTDEQPAAPAPAAPPQQLKHGGETILLVEDEAALRAVTVRILTRNGYRVIPAGSGPEALHIAEDPESEFDLLLTDVVMPLLHGNELAERIRRLRPGVPVVYMSGYAQPFITGSSTLDASTILITKPFTQTDLLQRLREALDN
ncbi:putative multi-sensor signal transduction histidine kinase [Actinoplanes missouriensis 431]|uniref:histidine kinase n=1 Tax=Actinoplanes missouriensis (strain ATCC 14538 / DSM 43046 / CBS 188.64 / JCM 3121 / NBRC 102363 / NCIMB 12654 / NRRL B-3342 / UNCC 431) TaxID=512565 RepID=I0HGS5_ACTM4|nr:PAS domain S-box protein [Actinoplanes missouriensis]BAL92212.1 putative multi-sensor signal transduction histidine kinase [Actinoplanes missouriensis 431]